MQALKHKYDCKVLSVCPPRGPAGAAPALGPGCLSHPRWGAGAGPCSFPPSRLSLQVKPSPYQDSWGLGVGWSAHFGALRITRVLWRMQIPGLHPQRC